MELRVLSAGGVLLISILGVIAPMKAAEVSDARCRVFPAGSETATATLDCAIRQDMGLVLIRRSDGVVHDLRPAGDKPGLYMDQNGGSAYGRPLPDGSGFLFRFNSESVEIRWEEGADVGPR